MTQLETTMDVLMKIFDSHAILEGNPKALTKLQAKKLLVDELPKVIKMAKNQDDVDNLLQGLDVNGDNEIDFKEFMVLISAMICAYHSRNRK